MKKISKTSLCLVIAACLISALVLSGCRTQFKPNIEMDVRYLKTVWTNNSNGLYTIIKNGGELNCYVENREERFRHEIGDQFRLSFERYDETYFESKFLIIIELEASSGSYSFDCKGGNLSDDTLNVKIDLIAPDLCTCDMAGWFIFLELNNEYGNINKIRIL